MKKPGLGRRWLPLNALRAFEAVAKHNSFTAAANTLLVSQSSLSRHVISLEALLGVQLFDRKPHALALTRAGQHLLPALTRSFDRLELALDELRHEGAPLKRTLRVQMPPTFAGQMAVPILRDFRQTCGDVEIDLVSAYGPGSTRQDVDLTVTYSRPEVSHLIADLLWNVRLSLMCHPALAERHAGKDLPTFLSDNELIHVRLADMPRHHIWAQFLRRAGITSVNSERGVVFDTAALAVQYAMSGEGVVLVDDHIFGDEVASGRLVKPFPDTLEDGYGYYLLIHPEALGDPAVALFRSWLIDRFGSAPADKRPRPAAAETDSPSDTAAPTHARKS